MVNQSVYLFIVSLVFLGCNDTEFQRGDKKKVAAVAVSNTGGDLSKAEDSSNPSVNQSKGTEEPSPSPSPDNEEPGEQVIEDDAGSSDGVESDDDVIAGNPDADTDANDEDIQLPPEPFCMKATKGDSNDALEGITHRVPSSGSGDGRYALSAPFEKMNTPYGSANFFDTNMDFFTSSLEITAPQFGTEQVSGGVSHFKRDFYNEGDTHGIAGAYGHVHGGGEIMVEMVTNRRTFRLVSAYIRWAGHQDPFIVTNGKDVYYGYKSLDFGLYYTKVVLEDGEYPKYFEAKATVLDNAGSGGYVQSLKAPCS